DRLYVGTTILVPPPEALDRSLVERPRPPDPRRPAAPLAGQDREARRAGPPPDVTLVLPVGRPVGDAVSQAAAAADPDPSASAWPEAHRPMHRVRPGETLRRIASDRLGDPHRAEEIRELNRDVIADPHRLAPGMSLRLPANAGADRVIRR
ncbi:MAG TPA: LysM domain-containing protein, partial [Isosphaeraceae bacterium]